MDHANVQIVGIVGVFDMDHLAIFFDGAGFRLIQAKQDAHQGGFPRAVFPQQGVYLPLLELQGNIVVCLDAGEFLGDV